MLDDLQQLPEPATIRLVATDHYWRALHDELVRAGHTVQVLNPPDAAGDRLEEAIVIGVHRSKGTQPRHQ